MVLNPDIHRAAALAVAAFAAFRLISTAAAFVAALGTGRWVDRALNDGRKRLGLNLRQCFRHRILRQSARKNGCRNGRDLHQYPLANLLIMPRLLARKYEEFFNHLVVNLNLEKCLDSGLSVPFSRHEDGPFVCIKVKV
jgi:hypothetical protein